MDFINRTVLITGASAGIGEEFSKQLHSKGAHLILVARREEKLKSLVASLNAVRADSAEYLTVDLSQGEQVRELADDIRTRTIDILINNAGFGSFGCFEKLDIESEIAMMRVNAEAPMILNHAVIPQMKERKSGAIIAVSSIAGMQPLPYMSTYASTKAVNLWQSLALRQELKSFGIKVLAVCPGPVATEFGGVARVPGTFTGGDRDGPEDVVSESLRALEGNSARVVPCLKPKFLSLPSRFLPLSFTTWITGIVLNRVLPWAPSEQGEDQKGVSKNDN